MITKIVLVALASVMLGGCTLLDGFKSGEAATDEQSVVATSTPVPTASPDPELDSVPATSSSDDTTSLQTDIDNTVILEEDFSDLE